VPTITSPASSLTWKVGDLISFSGQATDAEDGTLPASDLSWSLILHHCFTPGNCHIHQLQAFDGVSGGSFNAPDHGYPSYLELLLTATDSNGVSTTTSVSLQPQTVNLTIASNPSGLQSVFDSTSQTTPFTVTAIIGSTHSLSAPATQTLGSSTYTFGSWSDGGAATHNITAPATAATYTETYTGSGPDTPPTAVATANPTSGAAPLVVNFDGSGSSDPDPGDTITYSWDLNGDGAYGDSTGVKPSFTYATTGTYQATLKATDSQGVSTTSSPITITVTNATTFGVTTPGTKTDSATADTKEVTKYTAPQAGNVTKLTGYLSGLGSASGSQPIRAIVYADSGGVPGARLGVSNAVTISAGRAWGWVDFTFPSAVPVSAGTVWMGYIAGTKTDLVQMRFDQVSGSMRFNKNSGGYAAGATNPFGSATSSNKNYSLYATYG
jgi:PKD repeat protein